MKTTYTEVGVIILNSSFWNCFFLLLKRTITYREKKASSELSSSSVSKSHLVSFSKFIFQIVILLFKIISSYLHTNRPSSLLLLLCTVIYYSFLFNILLGGNLFLIPSSLFFIFGEWNFFLNTERGAPTLLIISFLI